MRPLTRRQQEVLEFMMAHWHKTGQWPTLHELGRHFNLGHYRGGMATHLRLIRKKGYLTKITTVGGNPTARNHVVNPGACLPVCEIVDGVPVTTGEYLAKERMVQP
jgi:SOS-response transcriptional repressor LexA